MGLKVSLFLSSLALRAAAVSCLGRSLPREEGPRGEGG